MNRWALVTLLVVGCAAPKPVLVAPTEVDSPPTDIEALGATEAAAEGRAGTTVVEFCTKESFDFRPTPAADE